MTARSRTYLKGISETGDTADQTMFTDFVDSDFNKTDDDTDDITESATKKFLDSSSEQVIAGDKEFSGQAVANNASNAVKTFTATPTFDFSADGNCQKMTLSGNVTSFATSNEKGSGFYMVWLVNDASAGRTVAAPTGWTAMADSDTHSTDANAINLYQFFTDPANTLKYYAIKNL